MSIPQIGYAWLTLLYLCRAARVLFASNRIAHTAAVLVCAYAVRKIIAGCAQLIGAVLAHPRATRAGSDVKGDASIVFLAEPGDASVLRGAFRIPAPTTGDGARLAIQ